MKTYTTEEMLLLWKRQLHLLPAVGNAVATRGDDSALNALLLPRIEQWYAHLLLTAPPALLPLEDMATLVSPVADSEGIVRVELPERCIRPVEWRLDGWRHSVTAFLPSDHPIALEQSNEWTRGGCVVPVAVWHGRTVTLYSLSAGSTPQVTQALCVAPPGNGSYILDTSLLSTIEPWSSPKAYI